MRLRRKSLHQLALAFIVLFSFATASTRNSPVPDRIPPAEFSRIIRDFSEEGGYFLSDNLVSNENAYLSVVNKLRDLRVSGGAYIGVGPEQNFTYIARTHPMIAFIIDIRRQAMIQHLMYKALFHLSMNRAQFLARLLSRPLTGRAVPDASSSVRELMGFFSAAPADSNYFTSNLADIERVIQSELKFPLSPEDRESLVHVYRAFYTDGVAISFRLGTYRRMGGFGRFPSMRDLAEALDPDGKPGSYLARPDDYQFLRELHEKNRIIPLVGDFGGPKTLKSIAGFLRINSCTLNVFYASNVEMYLFQNDSFANFVENVKSLPVSSNSLFIRSVPNMWRSPFPGNRMTTLLQYISVFTKDYGEGLYTDYWTLVNTHFLPLD
jgi:hypothetical protein